MIPTSAVRETLILILFGIILVPIAAKRAQDARGYWQTFQLQDLTRNPSSSSSSSSPYEPLVVVAQPDSSIAHDAMVMVVGGGATPAHQNETLPPPDVHAPSGVPRAAAAAETRTGLTIRFGSATAAAEAMATAAPRIPQQQQQQQQQQVPRGERETHELPMAAKASGASNGRWTLIWMGSAIAAVAVFMSLC